MSQKILHTRHLCRTQPHGGVEVVPPISSVPWLSPLFRRSHFPPRYNRYLSLDPAGVDRNRQLLSGCGFCGERRQPDLNNLTRGFCEIQVPDRKRPLRPRLECEPGDCLSLRGQPCPPVPCQRHAPTTLA